MLRYEMITLLRIALMTRMNTLNDSRRAAGGGKCRRTEAGDTILRRKRLLNFAATLKRCRYGQQEELVLSSEPSDDLAIHGQWNPTMKPVLRKLARSWLPPVVIGLTRTMRTRYGYFGDYDTWAQAVAVSRGYATSAIYERTLQAARAVRDGQALWERDSVTFNEPCVQWPLLTCLLQAARSRQGRLSVLDVGGAFGSTWSQHRAWLEGIELHWRIVEQAHLVAAGRAEFANDVLEFHETIDAACQKQLPDVLLLSSVLPYVEDPHFLLADLAHRGFRHVIIDRTGFVDRDRDRLTLQRVSPTIYDASYPCWFFSRTGLLKHFSEDYQLTGEWPGFDLANIQANFRGLFLTRRPGNELGTDRAGR